MELTSKVLEDAKYFYETIFGKAKETQIFKGKYGPVIGISGVYGGWVNNGLKKYMEVNCVRGVLSRYDNFTNGLESYFPRIQEDINKNPGSLIVAYSAAGLSALLLAKRFNLWNRFKKIITVGAPFRGVETPPLVKSLGQTFIDISPESSLINEVLQIKPPKEKVLSIFAEQDEHIPSPKHLKLNWPTVVLGAKSHGDIQNHQVWIANILDSELGIENLVQ